MDNLQIQNNLIESAIHHKIQKFIFLGSSCIYPKLAPQPLKEEYLLTGSLEPTNQWYAIAKIAGIKLCESYNRQYGFSHGLDFRSVMPTNLFGPGDNYHPLNSHVIPALIRRFHEAGENRDSEVVIWGTGKPKREFLYVDDMAAASVFVMNLDKKKYHENTTPMQNHLNVGFGSDITIAELANAIALTTSYKGRIVFDGDKPDGPMQKLMDTSVLNRLGWNPQVDLKTGLQLAYEAFKRFK
jgi:GDP-L-fucose synthase